MRRIGVGDEPPVLDRAPDRGLGGFVIQVEPLGDLVHGHPMAGSAAAMGLSCTNLWPEKLRVWGGGRLPPANCCFSSSLRAMMR